MGSIIKSHRDRAVSQVNTMDEPEEEETDLEETPAQNDPVKVISLGQRAPEHTPFFTRMRQRMTWGTTTKEEKRSLWSESSKANRNRRRRAAQRQSTIGVPTDLLLQALCRQLTSAGENAGEEEVAELSALLRMQLRHELMESSLWLVDAFDVLSSDNPSSAATPTAADALAGERVWPGSIRDEEAAAGGGGRPRGVSTTQELEALSDRFIDGLCALMQRAAFKLFSQREWQFAKSENFMFTLPVDVSWESLDSATISRLFVRHPHLGLQAAQLARRVLVFHRGAGVAQLTSYFLEEKFDMLIDRLFTHPFKRLMRIVQAQMCPQAAMRAAEAEADALAETKAATWEVDEQTQRINLTTTLPTLCALLTRFFRRLTIQEPTLQDVVVVYTEIAGADDRDDMGYGDTQQSNIIPGSLLVRLKSFRDIPTADVEVVLPGLRASRMKDADVVKIVLYLLGGIATAIYGFLVGTSGRNTLIAILLSLLALRAYQTWASVSNAKHTMNEFIRTTLYHRSQDSQRGVLLSVLNSIAQHELREALTIYLLMRSHGLKRLKGGSSGQGGSSSAAGSVTVAEAEQLTADFLEREFSALVHVKADEALERLQRLGLVRRDGGGSGSGSSSSGGGSSKTTPPKGGGSGSGRKPANPSLPDYESYTAVPMPEALSLLREIWGDHGKTSVAVARQSTRQHPPSLLQLTDPSPAALRRQRSDGDVPSPEVRPTKGKFF